MKIDTLDTPKMRARMKLRVIVGVSVALIIAAIHGFRLGNYLNEQAYIYYYSFASDILVPYGIYFLLTIQDVQFSFLRGWYVKAGIIFLCATITEVLQAFDVYFLGVAFDPLDILMFGVGVLLAATLEKVIVARLFKTWSYR
jgi:hypothetical protein